MARSCSQELTRKRLWNKKIPHSSTGVKIGTSHNGNAFVANWIYYARAINRGSIDYGAEGTLLHSK